MNIRKHEWHFLSKVRKWIMNQTRCECENHWSSTSKQLCVHERMCVVTDLREDSRYPSLAWSMFFPILLLIVYKKNKTKHKWMHCVPEPTFTICQITPPPTQPHSHHLPTPTATTPLTFHVELVNDPVLSRRAPRVQGRGVAPPSTEPQTSQGGEWGCCNCPPSLYLHNKGWVLSSCPAG